jgi:hypothetical protein
MVNQVDIPAGLERGAHLSPFGENWLSSVEINLAFPSSSWIELGPGRFKKIFRIGQKIRPDCYQASPTRGP